MLAQAYDVPGEIIDVRKDPVKVKKVLFADNGYITRSVQVSGHLSINTVPSGNVVIKETDIDNLILALQKAKEVF